MTKIKISKTHHENTLYEGDIEISGQQYRNYLDLVSKTIKLWNENKTTYNEKYTASSKLLYDYISCIHRDETCCADIYENYCICKTTEMCENLKSHKK